jgi:hypothetical protein
MDVSTQVPGAGKLRRNASQSRALEDSGNFKSVRSAGWVRSNNAGDWDRTTLIGGIGELDALRRNMDLEQGLVTGPVGRQRPRPGGGSGSATKAFGWAHPPVFWGRLRPGTIGGRPLRDAD